MSSYSWESAWRLQRLKEKSFMVKYVMDKSPKWVRFVSNKVPSSLQKTLELAFNKAFVTVFEKAGAVIEKTYNKQKQKRLFRRNSRALDPDNFDAKLVKKFENQAKRTTIKNLMISAVEGVGLGLFGVGLPDIPLFVSVMLKSIYEIATSYGFEYDSDREKLFILKMIDASLASGEELKKKNAQLNALINRYFEEDINPLQKDDMEEFVVELQIIRQIDHSAEALSRNLLYGKFVQSMTFVGVVGGTADFTCLKRITDYANLKYKRRFLLQQMPELEEA